MTESRSSSYLVKLYPDEKAELARLADEQGISLADAFRNGAKTLLSSTPEQREANKAAEGLLASVEKARSVLDSLKE